MKKALLLAIPMLTVTLLALAPAGSAGTSCAAGIYLFSTAYDCDVEGVGGSGTLDWCPDQFSCVNHRITGCYVDDTGQGYCWL